MDTFLMVLGLYGLPMLWVLVAGVVLGRKQITRGELIGIVLLSLLPVINWIFSLAMFAAILEDFLSSDWAQQPLIKDGQPKEKKRESDVDYW